MHFYSQFSMFSFRCTVAPVVGPYLRVGNDIRARLAAVCLFDDCVEHCGAAAAAKFAPQLVEGAVAGLHDDMNGRDPELKRASIYGIAQISRYALSDVLLPYGKEILPQLFSIASKPKTETDNVAVFENAVSCLASLALFGSAPLKGCGFIKHEDLLKAFLTNLPLREDEDEAMICSAGLCDMIEKGVISTDIECGEILRVIGETLELVEEGEDLASTESCLRFAGILFKMQLEIPGDRMEQAFSALRAEAQSAVNAIMV